MSLALSSNDAEVISRALCGKIKDKTPCDQVFDVYEIQSSVDHINVSLFFTVDFTKIFYVSLSLKSIHVKYYN